MPTPIIIPSSLQWLGFAPETTYGVAPPLPLAWIPADQSALKWKPNQKVLPDTALRGLMGVEYQQVQGMRTDSIAYKAFPYMDSIYQHFLALYGRTDTVTGTADPATHKTSLENGVGNATAQPKSYTFWFFDGNQCWTISGCLVQSLKLTVKVDELVTVEPTWLGLAAVKVATPANTPSTNKPMPSWNSTISLAGSAVSVYSEVALEYKRDAAEVPTINGSQSPLAIFGGGVSVAGTLTAVYQGGSDTNLTDYLTNVQPPLSVKIAPAGDAVHSLTLQHSVIAFDAQDPSGSNKWMEITGTVKALMNATDALDSKQSPGQAIFLSPQLTAF